MNSRLVVGKHRGGPADGALFKFLGQTWESARSIVAMPVAAKFWITGRSNFMSLITSLFLCSGIAVYLGCCGNRSANVYPQIKMVSSENAGAATTFGVNASSRNQVASWVAIAMARPLFSPNRAPAQGPAQPINPPPPPPSLSGVMVSSEGQFAIFRGNGGPSIVVQRGNHIGAFKVLMVSSDTVEIAGPAGVQRLRVNSASPQQAPPTTTSLFVNNEDYPNEDGAGASPDPSRW